MPEPYELYPKSTSPTARTSKEILALVPVEIGMMGFSVENISQGKKGFCRLPLGERDSTKWGGRKYVRIKLTAMENVRANRDIIVANEQGEIKEHTPVELSYEKHTGGYQRAGENYPLPTSMGSKAISYYTAICTAAGNTILITPTSGKKLRIHFYAISNSHAIAATIGMRFTDAGDIKHRYTLASSGGNTIANLTDCCWEGAVGQALVAYLSAAYASGVIFTIGYTEEDA